MKIKNENKLNNMAICLNGYDQDRFGQGYGYSYGYSYGYGYGYGNGYGSGYYADESKVKNIWWKKR